MTDQELKQLEDLEESLRVALKLSTVAFAPEAIPTCIENALAAVLPRIDAEYARRHRAKKERKQ